MSLTSHFTTPDTWCLEKREIPTVSKFDEIRHGSYILRDDSNGEVRFIIRDLENFRILTKITILPFFIKLDFLGVSQALYQPPRSGGTSVVREFYTNLASHILKRVWVSGVLVDFSAKSINRYYNLEPVNPEAYDRLHEYLNYPEVLRMLTNEQGE